MTNPNNPNNEQSNLGPERGSSSVARFFEYLRMIAKGKLTGVEATPEWQGRTKDVAEGEFVMLLPAGSKERWTIEHHDHLEGTPAVVTSVYGNLTSPEVRLFNGPDGQMVGVVIAGAFARYFHARDSKEFERMWVSTMRAPLPSITDQHSPVRPEEPNLIIQASITEPSEAQARIAAEIEQYKREGTPILDTCIYYEDACDQAGGFVVATFMDRFGGVVARWAERNDIQSFSAFQKGLLQPPDMDDGE